MKKIVAMLLLLFVFATPSYALNILERLVYKEVRLGGDKVLVNKLTGKVEKKMEDNQYAPISSAKGWGGIPSEQDMYQARYDRKR
jgi:hypothetical protein